MIFDFIIIGAGLSGSYAASKLVKYGKSVLILEKSRGIGGRLSTKPISNNIVDYGCQYINPKTNLVKNILKDLEKNKILNLVEIEKAKKVYIAPYGMNKVPQYFSMNVPVLTNTKVIRIQKNAPSWSIKTDLAVFKSRFLISSIPIHQNIQLFKESNLDSEIKDLPKLNYKSFFTIMCACDAINKNIVSKPNEDFSWICNNTLKGLRNINNIYTINTSTSFTNQLMVQKKDQIIISIKKKLELFGIENLKNLSMHFWKYAYSEASSGIENYLNSKLKLGLCGDAFGKGKIDGAITSADSLVKKII